MAGALIGLEGRLVIARLTVNVDPGEARLATGWLEIASSEVGAFHWRCGASGCVAGLCHHGRSVVRPCQARCGGSTSARNRRQGDGSEECECSVFHGF